MEGLFSMGWLGKSLFALFVFCLFMLSPGFLQKNFNVRTEVFFAYWGLGYSLGLFLFTWIFRTNQVMPRISDFAPCWWIILVILLLSMTLGTLANLLMAQAISSAPNPGLPFTIINASGSLVYLFAFVAAAVLPKYFEVGKFSLVNFVGILLVIIGLGLTMFKSS